MKSSEAIKILQQANGKHLEKIYIPSLQEYVFFYPLLTSHVKTLTRIDFLDKFDLTAELLKLNLFDKLCTEDLSDRGITSHTITEIFGTAGTWTIKVKSNWANMYVYAWNSDLTLNKEMKAFVNKL